MTEPRSPRLRRSAAALLAGFVIVVILSIATDMLLHATGLFPPLGRSMSGALFLLATAYRTAFAVAGSYVTARLAPDRPMQHALVGGIIGLVLSTVGAVATWGRADLGPHWYPLALIATAMPSAWAGGKLCVMTQRQLGSGVGASRRAAGS